MLKTASHLSWVSMAVAILGILMTAKSLPAQPVIESAIYYTDFWYENPLGWPTGHRFVAYANVQGDGLMRVEAEDQKGNRIQYLKTTETGAVDLLKESWLEIS